MFIHIDCNSYFASCDIAADRALEGKPMVVANDNEAGGGIVLALNDEAKALGLRRGQPLFQVRALIRENGVQVCHADHGKYHTISASIMQAVQRQGLVVDFVQYSVDEFFGTMPLKEEAALRHYVGLVKQMIWDDMHIPVSCGCAASYTLAKTATYFAKHYTAYDGICVLPAAKRERALALLPIGEVWGIGRKSGRKMETLAVRTALDYVRLNEKTVRDFFGTGGWRTWRELQGLPAISLERPALQKSIAQSRTFAYMTTEKATLAKEITSYAQSCCATLRKQQSMARTVTLFLATNPHRADLPQYSNGASTKLRSPSDDSSIIIKAALSLLETLFRSGYQYKRAGVILSDITQAEGSQLDLFTAETQERRHRLMQVADAINHKFGNGAITFSLTKEEQHNSNAPLTYPNDEQNTKK